MKFFNLFIKNYLKKITDFKLRQIKYKLNEASVINESYTQLFGL